MEESVKYAGFWTRVLAIILDGIVLSVISYFIQIFASEEVVKSLDLAGIFESTGGFTQILDNFIAIIHPMLAVYLITLVINILYWVVLTGKFGATLGKMAMGIKVVKDDLNPIGWGGAFVREFLVKGLLYPVIFFISSMFSFWLLWSYKNPLSIFLIFIGFLGYLWVAWDERKQGWHDKIAHTVVIKEERLAEPDDIRKN